MTSIRLDTTRRVEWPYCIERLNSGRYVLLNRLYKPLGIASTKFIRDYGPWSIELALTDEQAAQLSFDGRGHAGCLYLYNDGTIPTCAKRHMEAYKDRLALLASFGGPDLSHVVGAR